MLPAPTTASLPYPALLRARRPEPFKYIHFPTRAAAQLTLAIAPDASSITLSCALPLKGVVLDVADPQQGDAVRFADQALDLVPGDPQTVAVSGLAGREVRARFLGDGSA